MEMESANKVKASYTSEVQTLAVILTKSLSIQVMKTETTRK